MSLLWSERRGVNPKAINMLLLWSKTDDAEINSLDPRYCVKRRLRQRVTRGIHQ